MSYIIIGLIILILVYFFITFNILVTKKNKVKEAFSTMDVYLKKRWDLIPNLVETTKGYAKYESNTLKRIIEERNNYNNLSTVEKLNSNEKLSDNLTKLMALVESYPELKANENFLNLSEKLSSVEDEIAHSRKYYNASVREYNNKVQMFPSNIVAKILGYKEFKMFNIEDNEKENIKVEL